MRYKNTVFIGVVITLILTTVYVSVYLYKSVSIDYYSTDIFRDVGKAIKEWNNREFVPLNRDVYVSVDGISDEYLVVVDSYCRAVMEEKGYMLSEVYDYCEDPDYGGLSVHMLFDNRYYRCIWINPNNKECVLLYNADTNNPLLKY